MIDANTKDIFDVVRSFNAATIKAYLDREGYDYDIFLMDGEYSVFVEAPSDMGAYGFQNHLNLVSCEPVRRSASFQPFGYPVLAVRDLNEWRP